MLPCCCFLLPGTFLDKNPVHQNEYWQLCHCFTGLLCMGNGPLVCWVCIPHSSTFNKLLSNRKPSQTDSRRKENVTSVARWFENITAWSSYNTKWRCYAGDRRKEKVWTPSINFVTIHFVLKQVTSKYYIVLLVFHRLEILTLEDCCEILDRDLLYLLSLSKLQCLQMWRGHRLSTTGLLNFIYNSNFLHLRHLDFFDCSNLNDEVLQEISIK